MRLNEPRISPLRDDEYSAELQALTGFPLGSRGLNLVKTLARVPTAAPLLLAYARHFLSPANSLPARERELLIYRVGHLCQSVYELGQHVQMGLEAGLTPEELDRIKQGPGAGWGAADEALIRAADDIVKDQFVSDSVWQALYRNFDQQQLMDIVLTAAQYVNLASVLNTFGVQLEPEVKPDLRLREWKRK